MSRKKTRELFERDDYWMGMAFFIAASSKNPDRQEGAIILAPNYEVLSLACDGIPKSMQDSQHFVHAELNALFAMKNSIPGGTIYITHTPCYQCCLAMLAAGIKRVTYFKTEEMEEIALDALRAGYAQPDEFHGNLNWMRDYIKTLETAEIFISRRDK